jgi:hypothetical protein
MQELSDRQEDYERERAYARLKLHRQPAIHRTHRIRRAARNREESAPFGAAPCRALCRFPRRLVRLGVFGEAAVLSHHYMAGLLIWSAE